MELPLVGLCDEEFLHIVPPSYCGYDQPSLFKWDRSGAPQKVCCFTERHFDDVHKNKSEIKIAWLLEPEAIHPNAYDYIVKNSGHMHFDYVLCFDERVKAALPAGKVLSWSPGGTWIWRKDWKIYPKTKNLSIIASSKDWTPHHRLRSQVINCFSEKFDLVCGYGRERQVENKTEALADYRYSVAIENSRVNMYFTDKLIDLLLCGTVPIYCGCPDIGDIFDKRGIIQFSCLEELKEILATLSESDYIQRMPAIQNNFKIAQEFAIVEDYMWNVSLKRFYE